MDRTDFTIISKPVAIGFECPHCEMEVEIPWRDADAPECWCDTWGDVTCPYCGELVKLGDWIYD